MKGPGDISAVVRYGEPCSRSGVPPGPLPDFTSIYKYFGGLEMIEGRTNGRMRGGRERECAKAENVGGPGVKIHFE